MWVITKENELTHYGVPGMKWGHRKAKPIVVSRRRPVGKTDQTDGDPRQAVVDKEVRKARGKKIALAGTAVAATALAAFGAYKLNKWVKSTNCKIAAERGREVANTWYEAAVQTSKEGFAGGRLSYAKVSSGAAKAALDSANRASRDNFKTAAKNVMDYKRRGNRLSSLRSVSTLARIPDSYTIFQR